MQAKLIELDWVYRNVTSYTAELHWDLAQWWFYLLAIIVYMWVMWDWSRMD